MALGGSSVLGPLYIAEIAPAKWREETGGFFQFNVVLGILLLTSQKYLIGTMSLGAAEWRWKPRVSALHRRFFSWVVPNTRSPRWLAKEGKKLMKLAWFSMKLAKQSRAERQYIVDAIDARTCRPKQFDVFSPQDPIPRVRRSWVECSIASRLSIPSCTN